MAAQKQSDGSSSSDVRSKIVDALMQLAGEKRWEDFTLSDVADRAGLSLAQFRDSFPSKGAVLGAFSRRIDKIALEGTSDDLADESDKDRLFDVLMRRLDAMAPYRAAIAEIGAWARRDLTAAAALNQLAVNSMRFMLEAARIDAEGPLGALKIQGLVLAWLRVLDVWTQDETPDKAPTMAALDKALTRGEHFAAAADHARRLTAPLQELASSLLARGFSKSTDR